MDLFRRILDTLHAIGLILRNLPDILENLNDRITRLEAEREASRLPPPVEPTQKRAVVRKRSSRRTEDKEVPPNQQGSG